MKISGTKMDFCQLKSRPREGHVTPLPSFFSRTFFLFSFTRFFLSYLLSFFLPSPLQRRSPPSTGAPIPSSCYPPLLLPLLHVQAAAADGAAGQTLEQLISPELAISGDFRQWNHLSKLDSSVIPSIPWLICLIFEFFLFCVLG